MHVYKTRDTFINKTHCNNLKQKFDDDNVVFKRDENFRQRFTRTTASQSKKKRINHKIMN